MRTAEVTVEGQLLDRTSGTAATGGCTGTATLPDRTCTALFYQGSGTRVLTRTEPDAAPSGFDHDRTSSRGGADTAIVPLGSTSAGTFATEPAKTRLTALNPDPIACATTGVSRLTPLGALTVGL